MTTIQVFANRESEGDAFREILPSQYEIRQDSEVRDADLYLVEDIVLSEYEDALRTQKDEVFPIFCPVIVVQQPEDHRLASVTPNLEIAQSGVVDDILQAPVTRQRLLKRVRSLVTRREQSQAMHEQLVELEDHSQQVERIASVLSHDLRNPIQVANLRVDLLQRHETDESIDTHVEPLARAIERIDVLTEDMLQFLQDDHSEDERRELQLEEIVRNAWKTTPDAGVEAVLELDKIDHMTIYGVRDRLLQVFENLFRNAIVHGGTPIRIEVGLLDDDDGLYIEDDGQGIPPEKREEIFRPGYSTRETGTESGLGLSIIQKIIENHGWEITATEGDTGGARFEIRTN